MDRMHEPLDTTEERTTYNGPTYGTAATGSRTRPREGRTTALTEAQVSRIPSMVWLTGAVTAMAASAVLQAMGREKTSLFVGQWAPTLLVIGLYNKLVKVAGHD